MNVMFIPYCASLSGTSRMIAIYRSLGEANVVALAATHGGILSWHLGFSSI